MAEYTAPMREMQFVIEELVGLGDIASLPGYEHATPDVVHAILEEANKMARDVLSPINRNGDLEGSKLENGIVITPTGSRKLIIPMWKAAGTPCSSTRKSAAKDCRC